MVTDRLFKAAVVLMGAASVAMIVYIVLEL
jgi:hypothetical protein